jgi:hypothetical protein
MGENNSVGGADNSTAAVLPATTNQPNTISQHTVTDTSGRNHATYADVDGRVFYATCASVCSSQASWSSVVLGQFDTGLVGNATPKIGVDSSGRIHIAIITDTTSLFTSDVHYASCDNACTQLAGWSIGFAFTLNETFILQDVQFHDWFAVSPSGVPHIALFGSSELFATRQDHLHVYQCQSNCANESGWSRQQVAQLNLAFPSGAHIHFDNQGTPHIAGVYTVVGANTGQLLYFTCLAMCDSASAQWSIPAELGELTDDPLDPHDSAFSLLNGETPVIATFEPQAQQLKLLTCTAGCDNAASWTNRQVRNELPLPTDLTLPEEHIVLNTDNGRIEIGMIGKDLDFGVAHRIIRLSCEGQCNTAAWSYDSLADTSPITLDDFGICVFFGTGAIGPINLTRGAVSYGLYPHWGCSGTPVLVTVPGFGDFIDTNDDLRFFEIAAHQPASIN